MAGEGWEPCTYYSWVPNLDEFSLMSSMVPMSCAWAVLVTQVRVARVLEGGFGERELGVRWN